MGDTRMGDTSSVELMKEDRGAGFNIDRVSHGGHGGTEDYLAVDQSLDAGFKPWFTKIK